MMEFPQKTLFSPLVLLAMKQDIRLGHEGQTLDHELDLDLDLLLVLNR